MKNINSILSMAAINAKKAYMSLRPKAIVCHELKLIYFPIPKVASSTIKSYLLANMEAAKPSSPRNKYQIHEHEFTTASKHDLKIHKNYVRFTVIRNPYDRIVSCYQDKIINEYRSLGHIHHGFTRYNTLLNRNLFHKDMEFVRFLEIVSKIPDVFSDEHFRSQACFLPHNKSTIEVDYLLEMESLTAQLLEMTIRENLPRFTEASVNKSAQNSSNYSLSEMDYIRINSRYSLDIRLLPYKKQTALSSQPQLKTGA